MILAPVAAAPFPLLWQRDHYFSPAFANYILWDPDIICMYMEFAVCAQQFVAMFVGGVVGGRRQEACSAYMTRSTRGLRRLLLEQV